MNQYLRAIQDLLQQNKTLSEADREALLKSIVDADKQWGIIDFKLDRTEKVKKTTAILLEETIEELEQKRKAVEAQNRELEIESSLEKVRTVAMGMRKRDDMLDICHMMSKQLESLGIKEIRNVQTAIFYKDKGIYANYEYYRLHDKALVTVVDYTKDKISIEFAAHMMKGPDEFFTRSLAGKEVQDWYHFQKTTNVFIDTYLEKAESLTYYWFSLGSVALGMSSYVPLSEKELNLFQRFRNVFGLAYQRYIDIEKAEAQAREAQIELALERVRARTMAMQKSAELGDVANVLFNEMNQLVENLWTCGFVLCEKDRAEDEWWLSSETGFIPAFYLPNTGDVTHANIYQGWLNREEYHTEQLEGEALEEHYDWLMTMPIAKKIFHDLAVAGIERPRWQKLHCAYFSKGYLCIITQVPCPEEQLFKRFAQVFDLTYTRFLDLQKAEAQAREAQIELALERVRARTMAMQKSEELAETSLVLFQQFKDLGETSEQISIGIFNEHENIMELYSTLYGSQWKEAAKVDLDEPVVMKKIHTAWKEQNKSLVIDIAGNDLRKYNAYRKKLSNLEYREDRWVIHIAFFSKGVLTFSTTEPHPTETIQLLERFAGVFDQTYTRFLDLQKAEAQAREAKIEAALERVRSRSMAMQKSEELKEVIQVVYEQFVHLNINTQHTGFVMDYKLRDDRLIWVAGKHGVPSRLTIPYFDCEYYNRFNEAKEKGWDFFATNLGFEGKNSFYRELFTYIPGLPEEDKEFYFSCPGLAISTVLLENVGLYIENFEGIPYTDEDNATLMRFGKVFQQTYTRFLDLQKAEAQAREAKIEAALERTRTQSMIMQHSNELDCSLRVFHEQVLLLGINSAFSFLWLPDEEKDRHIFWAAWGEDKNDSIVFKSKAINYPLDRSEPATAQCLVDWKGTEPIVSYHVPPSGVENYFAAWQELIDGVEQLKPEYFSGGLYYVEAFMKYGCFGVIVAADLTEDEKKILGRFAIEFERTYTRFLDLQKAEAQAREAQIEAALERVRSRSMAMHKSEELLEAGEIIFAEMQKLGIESLTAGIVLIDKEEKNGLNYAPDPSTKKMFQFPIIIPHDETIHLQQVVENWKIGSPFFIVEMDEDETIKHQTFIAERSTNFPLTAAQLLAISPSKLFLHNFYFKEGYLLIVGGTKLSAEQTDIMLRFAKVFQQTYTRFLDLQKAEAQAKEAKIEAALERVRSRTLAMQKSDELAETAAVLFQQLIALGIEPNRLYIAIVKDENGETEFWITDEDGTKVSSAFETNLNDNTSFKKMLQGWKEEKKSLVIDMRGEELQEYFKYLSSIHVPFKGGLTQKRRVQDIAYFGKGFIGIASPDDQPEETLGLLERFAAVFNLTYTRFNDLKIAEAHALQAEQDLIAIKEAKQKAEEALTELQATQKQLIQSEKMASLGELTAGIAHEIQNPLNFVNNFSDVSSELLDEMKTELEKGNKEDAMAIVNDVKQNLEKILHHGKRADAIVKGMLQHSRTGNGQKELTDLNALADEYLRLAYHGLRAKDKSFNATLNHDFDKNIEKVNIIPQDIGRVLVNLINNAFYVVNEKAKQHIRGYEPTVTLTTKKAGNKTELRVIDNGNGISQKVLDKIFQPFFTTKPTGQGTGLGLSLAYDIITKGHGGELKVETKEGEGSIFIIQLQT